MKHCLLLALLLLGLLPAAGAQLPIPHWHLGQSWRVQVPDQVARFFDHGGQFEVTDSRTRFTVYRFTVQGRRTLRFLEQDGNYHIGQAVPPEACWLVNITPERGGSAVKTYHCYFRVSDQSLREIYDAGVKGRGGYFVYSGAWDSDDKRVVEADREPFRAPFEPIVLDWPCFPLTTRKETRTGQSSQSVTPDGRGVRVVLQSGTESTTQTWFPGDPWWRSADQDGLQKSRLLGAESMPFDEQKGKLNP